MSKVIDFKDNPLKKAQAEAKAAKEELVAVKEELAFYKGLINFEKSISDLLKLQVIDLESNVADLMVHLNKIDNNFKGLRQKLAQVDQITKRDK